ncbi:MAG: DUF1573 domain-containing protein [Bacteroidetes bacterium]|nr:DUF1573 domain-containing protein [Bacteroidota bacterium]
MNKTIVTVLFFLGLFTSLWAQKTGPAIAWEETTFDFGDITQGEKKEHIYKFSNSGTEPLVITNVEVTCGCTTPKGWPRDPINPGGKGEVTIRFDSTHKIGRQTKVAVIVSNATGGNSQITFVANVLEKKILN